MGAGARRPVSEEGDFADVDLTRVKDTLRAEWMHPVTGAIVSGGVVKGGEKTRFNTPFLGTAALYLVRI